MNSTKLKALGQLLGCYFHQDWLEEFDSDQAALESIVKIEPQPQIAAGLEDVNYLLSASLSENDLREILTSEVGCYFDPGSEGMTYTDWLRRVRETFARGKGI
jgi:hypothetical protein